jgi:hypothetical protein
VSKGKVRARHYEHYGDNEYSLPGASDRCRVVVVVAMLISLTLPSEKRFIQFVAGSLDAEENFYARTSASADAIVACVSCQPELTGQRSCLYSMNASCCTELAWSLFNESN